MKHTTKSKLLFGIITILSVLSVDWLTCAQAWERITDPVIPTDKTLRALWGTSDADFFIVGNKGTMLHFDGSAWTKTTPTSQNLNDVWGVSNNTAYAVGNSVWDQNAAAWKATILKSADAGGSWVQADITANSHLLGIWGDSSAVIAVGSFGAMLKNTGGSDWPSIAGITFNTLNDIWGNSATEVYAVGFGGTIVRFKDDNWLRLSSGTTGNLQSISGSAWNGIYAVGFGGTILHSSDGENWVLLNSGTGQNLHSVWVSATTGNVFAVGDNGVILHKADGGAAWSKTVYHTPSGFKPKLYAIWGSPAGYMYIAGENGTILKQFVDSDNDSIGDEEDNCPSIANADQADADGDGFGDVCDTNCSDSDFDGVCDDVDNSPGKYNPDQGDYDQDGVGDVVDACIADPDKTTSPGACGCGIADIDSDGDNIPNCIDPCPVDSNPACIDECPNDPRKITPGQCGCGKADADFDNDGVANCIDKCPYDPNPSHQTPEVCGCFCDNDGDGYGAGAMHLHGYQCPNGKSCVESNTDCNDTDPDIHPYAIARCNGKDNNCDSKIDDVKTTYYRDADGDGYGNPVLYVETCPRPQGYVDNNTDCSDTNAGVNPAAAEVCDGIDNNCDGNTDDVHYAPTITYTGMYVAAVNTPVVISAKLTDPRQNNKPLAGKLINISVSDNNGTVIRNIPAVTNADGIATTSITGLQSGVYTVDSKFNSDDCYLAAQDSELLAIYDPSGGFVTGGGWIISPPGAYAYVKKPALTGKATFGFVSKYQKGAKAPVGTTVFKFIVTNLTFYSKNYEWLVVAGARAQYKGTGTINGAGKYGFMLTAIDGQVTGGGGVDKLRMKIWDKATGQVVYDNQLGAPDTASPATPISGGSIVVHK